MVLAYVGGDDRGAAGGLVLGALADGLGPMLATFQSPQVLSAFWRTLLISLLVVAVHASLAPLVAWVLVRHDFRGRRLLNGLIDLPFAVSPVVVGYMLLLLFGRQGLFAPVLEAMNMRVAFAVPGMVLATLFVTLPFMIRELMPVLQAFGVQAGAGRRHAGRQRLADLLARHPARRCAGASSTA